MNALLVTVMTYSYIRPFAHSLINLPDYPYNIERGRLNAFLPATLSCNLNTIIIDTPFDAFLLVAFALNCHSPHGLTYRSAFSCYGCSCRLVLALSVLTSPDARRNQSASESTARQRGSAARLLSAIKANFITVFPLPPCTSSISTVFVSVVG